MILCVIPFDSSDSERAERLCDLIYWQSGKDNAGRHVLLVATNDTHPERIAKVRISAELAFQTVDVIKAVVSPDKSKLERINSVFAQAAMHIRRNYRCAFLWMEADCVPLKKGWLESLAKEYDNQPRRYMGCHVKAGESTYLFRVAIYHPGVYSDLDQYFQDGIPFDVSSGPEMLVKSTKTKLIQIGKYVDGMEFNPEAVLFRRDESGVLVEKLIESANTSPAPKRRGRPPKAAATLN